MSCVHRIDTYFDLKIAWPDQIVTQNRRIYQHGIFYAGIDILSSAPMSRRDLTSWLFVTRDLFIKMNHYTVPSPSKFLNICQKMLLFNRVGLPKSDIRVYISFRFLSFSPPTVCNHEKVLNAWWPNEILPQHKYTCYTFLTISGIHLHLIGGLLHW